MGPTVWELEGPMPILKSSKRLVFTLNFIVGAGDESTVIWCKAELFLYLVFFDLLGVDLAGDFLFGDLFWACFCCRL